MSALMKKRPTEIVSIGSERFKVSKETAKAVLVLLKNNFETEDDFVIINESDAIKSLDERFTSPGACLQGARIKEGLSQVELAEKLKISQTNLSKMELGKRSIGKTLAKRIANVLKVDYRLFL